MKRHSLFALFLFALAVVCLCGCDPDKEFKDGKYSEAYTDFVKEGQTNEVTLKQNPGRKDVENQYGNMAIHDYFY